LIQRTFSAADVSHPKLGLDVGWTIYPMAELAPRSDCIN
jgi:hypothetical protein